MSNEAPKKQDEGSGAPAWVMTFADLMSLLMCFFVLLLSFSEMDLMRFKQIAGSMKSAFGVQREIKVKEPPKGTSVIAHEFSPGRPTPTPMQEIRQNTVDESQQTLEFTDAVTELETPDIESMEAGELDDGSETAPVQKSEQEVPSENDLPENGQESEELEQLAEMTQQMNHELQNLAEKINQSLPEEEQQVEHVAMMAVEIENRVTEMINKDKEVEEEKQPDTNTEQTQADASELLKALAPEIEQGIVSVETEGNKIVIRIKEKGSFPSGSSDLKGGFLPVIGKLRDSLQNIEGKVVVAGHTDNVPIRTHRFRSNWELSSSRAVTVVHELLQNSSLKPQRFAVEGHGDAQPIAPNDSEENRALNRRVELTIIQGESTDEANELSGMEVDTLETLESMEIETETVESPVNNLRMGADAERIDPENSDDDAQVAEDDAITPISDAFQPVIVDPFDRVMESELKSEIIETEQPARNEPEDVTIDINSLKNKLNSITERLNSKTEPEGQDQ